MDNSMDAFRHAAREIFGGNASDIFQPELSKEEALRRARRGPALDT
jgi:hypothetical protein